MEARLQVTDPTREFLEALKLELQEWIDHIDRSLDDQNAEAPTEQELVTQLFTEWATVSRFTIVEPTKPAALLSGQAFLHVEYTDAYLNARHHAGYLKSLGPQSVLSLRKILETKLGRKQKKQVTVEFSQPGK